MKNLFSIKSQEILIQIEWDLFHCDLEVKYFHMNSCLFFSSFGRIFIVCAWICGCSTHVHQVWQFEQLWITSRLEIKRNSVSVRVCVNLWEVWGLWVNSKFLLSNEMCWTCKSMQTWPSYTLLCVKPFLKNFFIHRATWD